MIAARQIAFGKAAGKGLSAKDYVQDGLVALVDGVENAGWGKHTHEPTYVNLITGEKFSIPNSDNAEWGDDCLRILESKSVSVADVAFTGFRLFATKLGIVSGAQDYTIECCLRTYSKDYAVVSFDGAFGRTMGAPSEENFLGSISSAWIPDLKEFQWCVNDEIVRKPNTSVVQHNFQGFYWNTREVYSSGSFRFGGAYRSVCKSDIHCARIYNRALTAEEIAHNNEIDKARFGL